MNCTKHDAHVAKLLLAKLGTIPGITPLYHLRSDKGTYRFLFQVEESLVGWAALRTLLTMAVFREPDGTDRTASLALGGTDAHKPNGPLLWKLECCRCCGLTPGEVMEVLKTHGYGMGGQP